MIVNRRQAVHRAKEAYNLWLTRGIKDEKLTILEDYFYVCNGWTVVMNDHGAVQLVEAPNGKAM